MSFVSGAFLLFLAIVFTVYYLIPPKYRWIVLLAASCAFYIISGWKAVFYLVGIAVTVYTAARLMDRNTALFKEAVAAKGPNVTREEKIALRDRFTKKKSRISLAALFICLGVLMVVKYNHFAGEQLTELVALFGGTRVFDGFDILVPLGLSFYTFQAIGYLLDVKRGKYPAEKNFARFLLFISFFPQIIQGPISRYDNLGEQLKQEHRFDYQQFAYGLQLMLWGFFKKMVIADRLSPVSAYLFDNWAQNTGLHQLAAVVFYSIQIYGDFSGGIDISRGAAQCLGIDLPLNFERPFFSKTLAEFWRRWHITLGEWMRDYVFYPISLSPTWARIGKWARNKINKNAGKSIPSSLTAFITFFLIGVWHGASWNFVVYGLYNATLVSLSIIFENVFKKTNKLLRVNESSLSWRVFQMTRTTVICALGRAIGHSTSLAAAGTMLKGIFTWMVKPAEIRSFVHGIRVSGLAETLGIGPYDLLVVFLATALVFVVSLLQERGFKIRYAISRQILPCRWLVWIVLILLILMFGKYGIGYDAASFIYGAY